MGGKNSKAAAPVAIPTPLPPSGFNVIVTKDGKELVKIDGAVTIEEQIMNSYEAGKQEGLSTIHRSLDSVAAQVYDNVHEQLLGMQGQQLTKAEELVSKYFEIESLDERHICSVELMLLVSLLICENPLLRSISPLS